jgi:hypothetical protein
MFFHHFSGWRWKNGIKSRLASSESGSGTFGSSVNFRSSTWKSVQESTALRSAGLKTASRILNFSPLSSLPLLSRSNSEISLFDRRVSRNGATVSLKLGLTICNRQSQICNSLRLCAVREILYLNPAKKLSPWPPPKLSHPS